MSQKDTDDPSEETVILNLELSKMMNGQLSIQPSEIPHNILIQYLIQIGAIQKGVMLHVTVHMMDSSTIIVELPSTENQISDLKKKIKEIKGLPDNTQQLFKLETSTAKASEKPLSDSTLVTNEDQFSLFVNTDLDTPSSMRLAFFYNGQVFDVYGYPQPDPTIATTIPILIEDQDDEAIELEFKKLVENANKVYLDYFTIRGDDHQYDASALQVVISPLNETVIIEHGIGVSVDDVDADYIRNC